MAHKNKRFLILIVLIAVIILVWIPQLMKTFKGGDERLHKGLRKTARDIRGQIGSRPRTHYSAWQRNPFIINEYLGAAGYKLKGIVWDNQSPYAVINNKVVRKGDRLKGLGTVTDIKPDRVIIFDGRQRNELKLGR
jgi:hypothetical protein